MTVWKKQVLARAIGIKKGKLGETAHFSEIIKLKFGSKNSINSLYFKAFLKLLLPTFFFELANIYNTILDPLRP